MSLINQMLRDLEQRPEDGDDRRRVRAVATAGGFRRAGWLVGLACLLLLLLASGAWWLLSGTPALPADNRPAELDVSEALVPVSDGDDAAAAAPVRLAALERVETRGGQRLRLDFDGDSAYRRHAGSDDRVVISVRAELPDAFAEDLPPGVAALNRSALDDGRGQLEIHLEDGWEAGALYQEEAPGGGDRLSLVLRAVASQPPFEAQASPDRDDSRVAEAEPRPEPDSTAAAGDGDAHDDAGGDTGDDAGSNVAAAEPQMAAPDEDAGMVRERRTPSDEERAAEAWDEARAALQRRRLAAAEAALERVLAFQPAHVPAREALADLLADTGRVESADLILAESLTIDALPASELGFLARQRARLWLDHGQTERGIEALKQVYPERDAAPESGALLAGLHYRQGDYREAAAHYERLLRERPREGAWWMGLGLAREGMADFEGAVGAYRNALAADGLRASVREYLEARLRELSD